MYGLSTANSHRSFGGALSSYRTTTRRCSVWEVGSHCARRPWRLKSRRLVLGWPTRASLNGTVFPAGLAKQVMLGTRLLGEKLLADDAMRGWINAGPHRSAALERAVPRAHPTLHRSRPMFRSSSRVISAALQAPTVPTRPSARHRGRGRGAARQQRCPHVRSPCCRPRSSRQNRCPIAPAALGQRPASF